MCVRERERGREGRGEERVREVRVVRAGEGGAGGSWFEQSAPPSHHSRTHLTPNSAALPTGGEHVRVVAGEFVGSAGEFGFK